MCVRVRESRDPNERRQGLARGLADEDLQLEVIGELEELSVFTEHALLQSEGSSCRGIRTVAAVDDGALDLSGQSHDSSVGIFVGLGLGGQLIKRMLVYLAARRLDNAEIEHQELVIDLLHASCLDTLGGLRRDLLGKLGAVALSDGQFRHGSPRQLRCIDALRRSTWGDRDRDRDRDRG